MLSGFEPVNVLGIKQATTAATETIVISDEPSIGKTLANPMDIGIAKNTPPCETIPSEVLGEIFLWCLTPWDLPVEQEYRRVRQDTVGGRTIPWKLAVVCNSWRQVALQLPMLWSFITIAPEELETETRVSKVISPTRILLERSKGTPLHIRIHGRGDYGLCMNHSTIKDHWFALLRSLIEHSLRWQDVDFHLERFLALELVAVKGHLPLLRTARLEILPQLDQVGSWMLSDEFFGSFCAFASCPSLTHFEIRGVPRCSPIPWSQITRFGGDGLQHAEQINIISQMPSLVHLQLGAYSDAPSKLTRLPVVSLPFLHTLKVKGERTIFDNLILPALRILDIKYYVDSQSLISLLHRSSCNLTSFTLLTCVSDTHLIATFSEMPSLISLTLFDYFGLAITNELLLRLTFTNDSKPPRLLPRLESLAFRFADGLPCSEHLFVAMVESRCRRRAASQIDDSQISSLRTIIAELPQYVSPKNDFTCLLSHLAPLQENGLEVSVQSRNSTNSGLPSATIPADV
ncbi:hypothetical protein Hypma_000301 [Hypsizygus marmoreus]|uniref:F-box domain-containing protein n=1 Tax=Hypsizygus marmoreus TaxID=39966 RepID=A0A369JI97_HYPMA|nr:hypothetical protein Hypma_000301 [Hypsizygus marmoreus]